MAGTQQTASRTWTVNRTPAETVAALAEGLSAAGGKVLDRSDHSLSVRMGSRLAYRLFGSMMAAGRGRIPMQLKIAVRPAVDGQSQITAEATSNPGWYLVSTRMGADAYEAALPQLLDYVQSQA